MPGKTADELAIRALTARFNHLDSQKRNSELAATFVENGVLVARDERFEGRPAIEAYFDTQQLGAPVNIGFDVVAATAQLGAGHLEGQQRRGLRQPHPGRHQHVGEAGVAILQTPPPTRRRQAGRGVPSEPDVDPPAESPRRQPTHVRGPGVLRAGLRDRDHLRPPSA
jgi:hypothetical protein